MPYAQPMNSMGVGQRSGVLPSGPREYSSDKGEAVRHRRGPSRVIVSNPLTVPM